ncbi:hypothetical protein X975_03950, partial [Stegodyphus mimosarum]
MMAKANAIISYTCIVMLLRYSLSLWKIEFENVLQV